MCAIPHWPVISTDTQLGMNELRASWHDTDCSISPCPPLNLQHLRDQPDSGRGRTAHQREREGTSDREVRLPAGLLRLLLWGRFPDACRTRWGEGALGWAEGRTCRLLFAPSASSGGNRLALEPTGAHPFSARSVRAALRWSKCFLHPCVKYTHETPESLKYKFKGVSYFVFFKN